jgi:hypothetical protein
MLWPNSHFKSARLNVYLVLDCGVCLYLNFAGSEGRTPLAELASGSCGATVHALSQPSWLTYHSTSATGTCEAAAYSLQVRSPECLFSIGLWGLCLYLNFAGSEGRTPLAEMASRPFPAGPRFDVLSQPSWLTYHITSATGSYAKRPNLLTSSPLA